MPLAPFTRSFVIVTALALCASVDAGERNMAQRADRLQDKTAEFYYQVGGRFRAAAHYEELLSDAAQLNSLASDIQSLVYNGQPANHVAVSLRQMDILIDRTKGFVDHIGRNAYVGQGHVHGGVGNVKYMLKSIANTVDNMRDDVDDYADRIGGGRRGTFFRGPHDHGIYDFRADFGHRHSGALGVHGDHCWQGGSGVPLRVPYGVHGLHNDDHVVDPWDDHRHLQRPGTRRGREF